MKKYAVHEGFVTSKSDGDRHFISFATLCDLYGVSQEQAVNWVADGRGKVWDNYVHVYPSYDGYYTLPAEKGDA